MQKNSLHHEILSSSLLGLLKKTVKYILGLKMVPSGACLLLACFSSNDIQSNRLNTQILFGGYEQVDSQVMYPIYFFTLLTCMFFPPYF